jgi:hypothetical protein
MEFRQPGGHQADALFLESIRRVFGRLANTKVLASELILPEEVPIKTIRVHSFVSSKCSIQQRSYKADAGKWTLNGVTDSGHLRHSAELGSHE